MAKAHSLGTRAITRFEVVRGMRASEAPPISSLPKAILTLPVDNAVADLAGVFQAAGRRPLAGTSGLLTGVYFALQPRQWLDWLSVSRIRGTGSDGVPSHSQGLVDGEDEAAQQTVGKNRFDDQGPRNPAAW
ncbi:MAG: hypothetical protein M0031_05430 [Thermaerobacter sp.]|nr:hypothetical protein [Thermaerobacter sp.]